MAAFAPGASFGELSEQNSGQLGSAEQRPQLDQPEIECEEESVLIEFAGESHKLSEQNWGQQGWSEQTPQLDEPKLECEEEPELIEVAGESHARRRGGAVLGFAVADMPASRRVPRPPLVIEYEEHMDAEGHCSHDGCRNNPAARPPYTSCCTSNDGAAMPPNGANRVLLHSCCAPCSGAMFEEMMEKGLDVTIFFYNPNIHPRKEYNIRKEENKRYAVKWGVDFVDCDHDSDSWFSRMRGLEYEPERGTRCTACFDMRMEVTAAYAAAHGFPSFTTTNATSRWKDVQQVNDSGIRAALAHGGAVTYWAYNWQTDDMTRRKYEISATERFYKQEYCGCGPSLRDSNLWRKQEGIPPVRIGGEEAGLGTRYFEDPEADAEEESQEVVDQFFAAAKEQFGDDALREKQAGQMREKLSAQFDGRQKSATNVSANNW